jgi:hypothetical protein
MVDEELVWVHGIVTSPFLAVTDDEVDSSESSFIKYNQIYEKRRKVLLHNKNYHVP